MGLFVAIDFNELKDYLAELQSRLPQNARLSYVKSFHLTLKFLGEIHPNKVEDIAKNLRKIKFNNFSVNLDSIGIFHYKNNVKVVWVGLKPEEKIIELQKQVDNSLKSMFKKEKDFKTHITLARANYTTDKKLFLDETKKIKVENKKIEINNFRLIRSALTPKGPVYGDLKTFNSD